MSSIKLQGDSSGTGVFTIATPNTNVDRSITLPDKAGAIAVGAGTIVQVVQGTTSTSVTVSTTTYTDTGLSSSITPTSSSNKILVMISQQLSPNRSADWQGAGVRILRDSTVIHEPSKDGTGPTTHFVSYISGRDTSTFYNINYLDSPATTSNITYKTQGRPYTTANSGNVRFQRNYGSGAMTSTITMIEVVA